MATIKELILSDPDHNIDVWNDIKWLNNRFGEISLDDENNLLFDDEQNSDLENIKVKLFDDSYNYFSSADVSDIFDTQINLSRYLHIDDDNQETQEFSEEELMDAVNSILKDLNLSLDPAEPDDFDNNYQYGSDYFLLDNTRYHFVNWGEDDISLLSDDSNVTIGVKSAEISRGEVLYLEFDGLYETSQEEESIGVIYQSLSKEFLKTSSLRDLPRSENPTHNIQIKDETLYNLAFELSKLGFTEDEFISIKEIKNISKSNTKISKLLTRKSGSVFISNHSNGFTIKELKQEIKQTTADNFVETLKVGRDLLYNFSTWSGAQILFKNKLNRVFRLDFNQNWSEKFSDKNKNISSYMKNSNHPTNKKGLLTFAWCRYTIFEEEDYVVLDEIQTDIDDDKMLGKEIMSGWEDVMMRSFIQFMRNKLGYRTILMPTYKTKLDKYYADPPMRLYKELPSRFGFERNRDDEDFLILENYSSYREYILSLL